MTKVSVVINCHNSEKFIEQALTSALNQTYKDIEIICYDNSSKDNTKKIILSFRDERIQYFYSNKFLTLGKARNHAIKQCKGEFIAFLDSDDIWKKDKLENQLIYFKDPEVGIVTSNTEIFNESGFIKNMYSSKNLPKSGKVFKTLFTNYNISLETAIIRSEVLKKLDYIFDERFEIIEEFDLFCRISINYQLFFVNKVLSKWRMHPNSSTWKNRELIWKERNLMLEQYKLNDSNFEKIFQNEIALFEKRTQLEKTLYLIQINNFKKARLILKKYLFKEIKWTFLYFLTFNKQLTKYALKKSGLLQ